ncbi:hypothetical protein GGI09_004607 [Coemansia sp. S100]|nr:hypothetical protein GGI09_004607 [Coemansia sp. S100]KAJ2425301.1 hypothetical protein GGF41_002470 [Coemansia sp. RSA 2531]
MFNTANSNSVDPSVYIIRTVVFCVMILAFVSFINALAFMFKANNPHTYATFAIMLQNLLLTLWASFMASRTFLPLDNPARDSESMFYWLNIAPLFIIGIIPSCTPMEPDNSSQVAA